MKKKIVLCLVLALLLSGCGGPAEPGETTAPTPAVEHPVVWAEDPYLSLLPVPSFDTQWGAGEYNAQAFVAYYVTQQEYLSYVEQLKNAGFTLNTALPSFYGFSTFYAENSEQIRICLFHSTNTMYLDPVDESRKVQGYTSLGIYPYPGQPEVGATVELTKAPWESFAVLTDIPQPPSDRFFYVDGHMKDVTVYGLSYRQVQDYIADLTAAGFDQYRVIKDSVNWECTFNAVRGEETKIDLAYKEGILYLSIWPYNPENNSIASVLNPVPLPLADSPQDYYIQDKGFVTCYFPTMTYQDAVDYVAYIEDYTTQQGNLLTKYVFRNIESQKILEYEFSISGRALSQVEAGIQ